MQKYLVEFIGTFFWVLVFCLSRGNFLAPLAIGLVLMAMVYMGLSVSGAHYNPAVTLAMWLHGKISIKNSLLYMIFQIAGAFAAACMFILIWGKNIGIPRPNAEINILKPLALEMIFTFALVLVALFVMISKKNIDKTYHGFVIGCTVLAGTVVCSEISGAAFNPAVAIGPVLADTLFGSCPCNPKEFLWIYIAGPFVGGSVAAIAYPIIKPNKSIE